QQRYDLFRKEYRLPPSTLLLLYQGWFAPIRNLATLIKGLAYLDERYHLIMMGYGSYANELEKLAQVCKVADRVIFVPAKSQGELLYYTASADIGVIPYTKDANLNNFYSSPNKLYEYIAAGLPVLANRLPYCEEFIKRFHNGLVADLNTPEAFARAVQKICAQDIEKLRRQSLEAYYALNWDREAAKLRALYQDLETMG
ncbi:MAG: glycosyltransferase, partial [Nitrososphaerales archaeon]